MNDIPLVSIVTPSYNQASFLEETILSVLNQDYPRIEYIIIDGGSTDASVDIIKKYADRLAYWISKPDDGQSAAINEGFRHGIGDILAWINADDLYLPGAVSKAVSWLLKHQECGIVYGDCRELYEKECEVKEYHAPKFELGLMITGRGGIPTSSTFLRRKVWERVGGFDESLRYVMDIDYWFRASQTESFGHLPELLSQYRIHSQAKTWDLTQSEARGREIVRMYEAFWNRSDLLQTIKRYRIHSLAEVYLYAAHLAYCTNSRNLCYFYVKKSSQMGIAALRPRLVRLLLYIFLGRRTENFLHMGMSRKSQ